MFPCETPPITRRQLFALAFVIAAIRLPAEDATPIVRAPVDSSNLASIGYDSKLRILEVEFRSGSVYRYSEVPEAIFKAFMAADSKGRYFSAHIRNQYRFECVQPRKAATPAPRP